VTDLCARKDLDYELEDFLLKMVSAVFFTYHLLRRLLPDWPRQSGNQLALYLFLKNLLFVKLPLSCRVLLDCEHTLVLFTHVSVGVIAVLLQPYTLSM